MPAGGEPSSVRNHHTRGPEVAITLSPETAASAATAARDLSPAAIACAAWFRRLARALKVCRLYRDDNAMVIQARDQVLAVLQEQVRESGGWTLHFTPTEIYLGNELVVQPQVRRPDDPHGSSGEDQLPFLFYRDGIRAIRFPPAVSREELETLFDALRAVGAAGANQDDLVTLLWQANLQEIQIEDVPVEQSIFISSHQIGGGGGATRSHLQRYGYSPSGEQIHADLGQAAGTQALHLDTFDDWELADRGIDVEKAYERMEPLLEYSLEHFHAAWEEENGSNWIAVAIRVFREMLVLDPGEETRAAVARAIGTWIGEAMQRLAFPEALHAVEILREFDPQGVHSESVLVEVATHADPEAVVEYLDQADHDEQGRFAALAVALGRPALDLAFGVMSKAREPRVRAAACTALTYLCADEPQLLAPYFSDAPGEVMVHLVFTLGQIGGPEVLDLLRLAAQHPEVKVRRQVVMALGGVPPGVRNPPLIAALDSQEVQVISAALSILTRDQNHKIAGAIMKRIAKPDFETLGEDAQWALFNALAEVADDECVEPLEEMLMRGGWFASRSFSRSAAARTLQRIATPRARRVLERGRRSFSSAIRHACNDVTRET